jgi:hypothetical protein
MSCPNRGEDIVAWLDRSLPADLIPALLLHLEGCPDCARFQSEQAELSRFLESAAEPELEPPARLWYRIESELDSRRRAAFPLRSWVDLFRIPRFGYGFGAAAILLLTAIVAIHTRVNGPAADEILARLDDFNIQSSGNPFLAPMEARNPFFIYERHEPDNPFQPGGGLK